MLILALESSAKSASAALVKDGNLLAQYFQNCGLTHSRTLLPMVKDLLRNTETELSDLDLVAVAHGPGSFTGIRIGVAAVKGLCWGAELPACGVSTLEAMAFNGLCAPDGAVICTAMDARRGEIYNALFTIDGGAPKRLCPDRPIPLAALLEELKSDEDIRAGRKCLFTVGDGAQLCCDYLKENNIKALLAPEPVRYQSAWGVAMAAAQKDAGTADSILPVYLRLSQAERERQAKMDKKL